MKCISAMKERNDFYNSAGWKSIKDNFTELWLCKINKSSPLSGIFNEVLIMFLKYHKYNINLKNHLVPDEPFNCIA
ncbi:hypothetical protein V1478_006068 [Vespula squamosa]|uniref:Uncharacterized protein n=1 Tax=Vespula squamosa TaxID=30214 RepID=A0ABD2B6U4_VESSQ